LLQAVLLSVKDAFPTVAAWFIRLNPERLDGKLCYVAYIVNAPVEYPAIAIAGSQIGMSVVENWRTSLACK
jgi:hypothetical protein